MSFNLEAAFPERISSRSIRARYIWRGSRQITKDEAIRCTHLLGISFQIQIFGGDDITYQRLQSLANVECLLGSNVVKGDIDIYRVSMNHISECFRALYLLCYRELEYYVTSLAEKSNGCHTWNNLRSR